MISLTRSIPQADGTNAEHLRISCLFDSYRDDKDVLFWRQSDSGTLIGLCDGVMTLHRCGGDADELREFINMLSPTLLFSSTEALRAIGLQPSETAEVMLAEAEFEAVPQGDELSSGDIYAIFAAAGLDVPDYPHFAVDLCRRINRGCADTYGIKGKCAAVTFKTGNSAMLSGLASLERGFGGQALRAIAAKNSGRRLLLCCRPELVGFYEKHGFKKTYKVGFVKGI